MNHALGAKSVSKQMEQEHNTADRQSRNWQSKNRMDPESTQTFVYMSEAGVSTPMLAVKFSRSSRIAATALEQKSLTQYEVNFFAGFIQQTGVRRFVNRSDGESAMKALTDAEEALE